MSDDEGDIEVIDEREDVNIDQDETESETESEEEDEEYPEKPDVYTHKTPTYKKEIIVVPEHERITSRYASLSEMTEAIGLRAAHIERGGIAYTDTGGYTNPIDIATKELLELKNPLRVVRTIKETETTKTVEIWNIREMNYVLDKLKKITFDDILTKTKPVTLNSSTISIKKGGDENINLLPKTNIPPISYWYTNDKKSKYEYDFLTKTETKTERKIETEITDNETLISTPRDKVKIDFINHDIEKDKGKKWNKLIITTKNAYENLLLILVALTQNGNVVMYEFDNTPLGLNIKQILCYVFNNVISEDGVLYCNGYLANLANYYIITLFNTYDVIMRKKTALFLQSDISAKLLKFYQM